MTINIDSKLKLNKRIFSQKEETLDFYQVYIDACICEKNGVASIKSMMLYNDLPFSYYFKFITPLIENGTLTILEEGA